MDDGFLPGFIIGAILTVIACVIAISTVTSDDTKERCLAAQGTYIDGECYKNVERLPL